jgi:tetratricopeptide (TPR) repeat protein
MPEIVQQQILALERKVGQDAKSPLFAQLANFYLEQNRAEDALRICDAGLANYPFYTTGHLIKGKALVALHMRAEARREFEFVLEFLPRNETVTGLLEQIPPSEDETLTAPKYEEQPEVIEPTYTPPSIDENRIPSLPQQFQEPEYSFSGFDQPLQEQQIELPPAPSPLAEPSFFDTFAQTPITKTTEDFLGFVEPSVETPEIPEMPETLGTSGFPADSGFDVQVPEPPSILETQDTSFADVPRTVTEPSDEIGFPLEATEQESQVQAPSEEESFALYASRRRAELKGEDTVSLEDYLSNAEIAPVEEVSLKLSISTGVQDKIVPAQEVPLEFPISSDIQEKVEDIAEDKEQLIDMNLLLPQISTGVEDKIEDFTSTEERPSDTSIVLPEIQPPELPISDSIQNNIEEIANKLKSAGKITPVIDIAQKETPPASEQDLPVSMGFVTPTLAEIYAKQGWFDDAIKAYKSLARNKPGEKERFEKRIEELEKLKSQSKK